jgi:hypothetical protein
MINVSVVWTASVISFLQMPTVAKIATAEEKGKIMIKELQVHVHTDETIILKINEIIRVINIREPDQQVANSVGTIIIAKPLDSCRFASDIGCKALACYDKSTKCGCRDTNGHPQYA